jgi:transposase
MSVFLDCFKNNGIDYLRIVDGKRFKKEDGRVSNKRTTIKNLGALKKFDDGKGDGLLKRLRTEFKNKTLNIGMSYSELSSAAAIPKIVIKNPARHIESKNIGYFFIENIFNKLGISQIITRYKSDKRLEYDILGITKLLIFGRFLQPQSKKATFENKDRYLFPVSASNNINEIYKTLDILDEKAETIQNGMNTRIKQSSVGRKSDLTFYDVTNYYFETMYGDDDVYELDNDGNKALDEKGKPVVFEKGFRKKGVSKEGKPNPLVSMGLFIDNNGIPVSYKLFPGNTQDKTTFKDMLKTTLNKRELGRVIVVADNGMNAQENMYLLTVNQNGYIITKSVKKSWSSVRDWALDDSEYDRVYKEGKVTFKSKSRTYERILKDKDGNSVTIQEKEIIYWSKKHYERELRQNEKFIEYLEACKENPDKLKDKQRKSQEFVKVLQVDKKTGEVLKTKAVVVLLEDKIQKYKETMGFYSIVSSEVEMSDKDIIDKYHGLSRIEDSFRIIKSDLEGRPIYVWTKKRINAHFLICFIALTIIRLMQRKILRRQGKDTLNADGWEQGVTAYKLKEILNNFQANHIGDGYYQVSKSSPELKQILDIWGIGEDLLFPDIGNISTYKDKIASANL